MADDQPSVSYSVKELVARVDAKLDAYSMVLQTKADRADVAGLHERVSTLEAAEHARGGRWSNWRLVSAVVAFFVSNGALWSAVLLKH